ncbi:hypothetical protein [Sphingomonas sp. PP-CC-3A-396]|uniref:hypothetical protein n=1 Tax=Sphingomonas sp. PP-CC-3A-396 TaxID=2135655 RepID=UPI00104EAE53|nr:hypothetical protein [Sphingomonas sp. PP-CC-3A-396]TCQ04071.1 hypothetical protein C8J40_109206 [Sphingomonas sp. PP-CC-3A-396]
MTMNPTTNTEAGAVADVAATYAIVDLRLEFRGNPYITLWRPKNAGYAYPLPWAGQYSTEQLSAQAGYYAKRRYRHARALDRWPVPWSVVERLAVQPAPGMIDGDAGPVLRNDARTRSALRRARYLPVRHHLEQGATAGEVASGAADHTITAKGAQP